LRKQAHQFGDGFRVVCGILGDVRVDCGEEVDICVGGIEGLGRFRAPQAAADLSEDQNT
jgi:hypothetical protein